MTVMLKNVCCTNEHFSMIILKIKMAAHPQKNIVDFTGSLSMGMSKATALKS